jgi:hypothetical protein
MDNDKDFCSALVSAVPALRPLLDEHLEDNFDEILPYVFLWDVALWAEKNVVADAESVKRLIAEMSRGLDHGEGDVPNLVAVGFLESLGGGTDLNPLLPPNLRAELIRLGFRPQ